ncbi:MAG: HD domain-containing protein [Chthoniobacter sp.]
MAHAVYTGATHDRLGHTLGVVEVANRMINALLKNARYHQEFGSDPDPDVPLPDDDDRHTIRLAALFHDTGHGPFSHASEPLIERAHANDFTLLRNILQATIRGRWKCKNITSEAVAVLLVLSEPLRKIFEHPRFRAPITNREELPIGIVARLLGSWRGLRAGYLAGVICGPIDADKLDYMARDSYFTGLPLGLDVERLINKLEVITIKPERVADPVLKERATAAPNQRLYELAFP